MTLIHRIKAGWRAATANHIHGDNRPGCAHIEVDGISGWFTPDDPQERVNEDIRATTTYIVNLTEEAGR